MTASRSMTALARFGYAARGVVYLLLGGIALSSAFAGGGREATSEGAISSLIGQPFGRVLLGLLAVGLFGHVLWRFAQSVLNADNRDGKAMDWVVRAALFLSGLTHAALAIFAARLALGGGGSESGGGETGLAAAVLQLPFGRLLVVAIGLAIVAAGVVQIYRGLSGKYEKWLNLPPARAPLLKLVCAYGLSARGAVFLILGGFFIYAGLTVDPAQAGSVAEALDWVRKLPFGAILYGIVALGLFAFGGYSMIEALYRRVDAPEIQGLTASTARH